MKSLLFSLLVHLSSACLGNGTLVYAEYLITQGNPDNDPGLGNGVEITLPSNGDGTNLQFTVPPATIAALSPGIHHLAVRAEDDEGNWSTTLSRIFLVQTSLNEILPIDSPVEELEVFLSELSGENDPETGGGVAVPLGNPISLLDRSHQFSGQYIAALPPGLYRLAARAKNEAGLWSPTVSRTVKLTEIPTPESFEVRYRITGVGVNESSLLSNGPIVNFTESYRTTHSLQNLAPGSYHYSAEVVTGFGQVINSANASFDLLSHLDYWDQLYFTDPTSRSNPAVAGPDADPNKDGITNRESFILGLDPENNALDAYGARKGRDGRGVSHLSLPPALPPGSSVQISGSQNLESPFLEHATISSPRDITLATDITSDIAAHPVNASFDVFEFTSDLHPSWSVKGFYQFTFDYSGLWPYEFD